MFVTKVISKISQMLLPSACLLCGYHSLNVYNLCNHCLKNLPSLPHCCYQCARFLPNNKLICGICLKLPPTFDRTFALFPYQSPIIRLVRQLKFEQRLNHAQMIGHLLVLKIKHEWYRDKPLPDLILPVPLHPTRLKERGFNQAIEIAKPIAKAVGIPIDSDGAKRIKYTKAQSDLPAEQRKSNIANAFLIIRNYSSLSIAVIDDVITTGYTIREFCKVIKQHGAKNIDVWCAARRG